MTTSLTVPQPAPTFDYEPRAWVGCLACYNEGRLSGRWMDADELGELADSEDAAAAFCPRPDHEELWVFDTEYLPMGECSPAEAARWARALTEAAEAAGLPVPVILEYVEDTSTDPDSLPGNVQDAYEGSADSDEDFAYNVADELGLVPQGNDWPAYCIDWAHAARELMYDYTVIVDAGTRHYFRAI